MTGIAVIIPCYNLGRTVEETVTSVSAQTHPAAEVVVLDDGSDDVYTQQVLGRLQARGTAVVRTPNRGVAAARNLGIDLTSSPYIVLLDADDLLGSTYLEKAARILDTRQDVEFVTCGIQAFEGASYTWYPPPCTLVDTLTRGGPHISTMFRRRVWEKVGGFDESLLGYEDTDFWISALETGSHGEIIKEPLLLYRVRNGSRYHQAIAHQTYVSTMKAIYQKHWSSISSNPADIILAKESFAVDLRRHHRYLDERRSELDKEQAKLWTGIATMAEKVRAQGMDSLDWGNLRSLTPINSNAGGNSIQEYYIERFLAHHKIDIKGHILEFKSPELTRLFGSSYVAENDVFDDLMKMETIAANTYDCLLLTQALHTVYDFRAALISAHRILKAGGVLFATVPCVSRVRGKLDKNDASRDFWRFTEASIRRIFSEVFPIECFEVTSYGNVMVYAAILHGLMSEDLLPAQLDEADPIFPALCCVRAFKPDHSEDEEATKYETNLLILSSSKSGTLSGAAILFYHRIASLEVDTNGLCVRADNFRDHMRHLRENYQPMALHELIAAASSGKVPVGAIAITLDDGYLDSLTTASPILAEFDIPATFFITTEHIEEEGEFWWDTLERVFLSGHLLPPVLDLRKNGGWLRRTETENERAGTHRALVELIYPLSREDRGVLIDRIAEWSGLDLSPRATHRPMLADEVLRLTGQPGHTIGAHTVSHLSLPLQPVEIQQREIIENKEYLEHLLQHPVLTFSYPYGEVNKQVIESVAAANFKFALTVEGRTIRRGANPLLLPRLEVKSCGAEEFGERLRRVFNTQLSA
jgi:peptidoglycan/xylan/chitin deacetylase (PgdA/CDA1 family)/glycosyltransferase involved in cell wall biosynthesis